MCGMVVFFAAAGGEGVRRVDVDVVVVVDFIRILES